MFDVFVAELRCPNCGSVLPIDANTAMQTHIRDDADGSELKVGFELDPRDLTTKSIVDSEYALIAEPPPGGPIRLLDIFTCPICETEQWALVTIVDRRIHTIEAVTLDRATLERANFISDVNAEILARSLDEDRGADPIEVLRRKLP